MNASEFSPSYIPDPDDVLQAYSIVTPFIYQTPVFSSGEIDMAVGGRVLLKAESLQRTGSFKIRGAVNRMEAMSVSERRRGVVAWSAGNHGRALAQAGLERDIASTIIIPADAPKTKRDAILALGAKIVQYDRATEDREAIGRAIAQETGAIIVPPYDDAYIIAGGGTAGLEFLNQASTAGMPLDNLVICVGGGGLIAGCALAAEALHLSTQIYAAEPEGFDGTIRSISAGTIQSNPTGAKSIADALMTARPGNITFELNRSRLAGGFRVSDLAISRAVGTAFETLRLVVEPGGAAALAAVLENPAAFSGGVTGVLLTGGNVDASLFSRLIAGQGAK
jgi:threonine dehydratase